jgi:hypothetical protein
MNADRLRDFQGTTGDTAQSIKSQIVSEKGWKGNTPG